VIVGNATVVQKDLIENLPPAKALPATETQTLIWKEM